MTIAVKLPDQRSGLPGEVLGRFHIASLDPDQRSELAGSRPVRGLAVLLFIAWLCLTPLVVHGQYTRPLREPIVIKVIRLDHADAERLASILRPLLTRDGLITAYAPTNTLIIRDRASLVKQLVEVIKGPSSDP